MKYKAVCLLIFLLCLLPVKIYSFQGQGPPPPTIPPPVGLPASISDKILFLIIGAILLGFFILTRKRIQ